jgi:hypothetical protein
MNMSTANEMMNMAKHVQHPTIGSSFLLMPHLLAPHPGRSSYRAIDLVVLPKIHLHEIEDGHDDEEKDGSHHSNLQAGVSWNG